MKLYLNPLWPTLALTLSLSPTLSASTALPTIVVSASRVEQSAIETPSSISLINRQEIEDSGAETLLQLLQAYGGLQIESLFGNGNGATLDLRGFGGAASRNTLVLVDGRRLNNSADNAAPDLNSIDLDRVERIEIVQGSAGTLYGNQAVGGMINIITRQADAFSADVELGAGSHHGRSVSAHLSQEITSGLTYRLSAKRQKGDNYRDNSSSDRKDFNLRFDYAHEGGELFLEQQRVDDFQELPGALFLEELKADRRQSAAAYVDDFSDTQTDVTRLGLTQALGEQWRFEGEYTQRRNEREFKTSFRTFSCEPSDQERKVRGFNPRLIGKLPQAAGSATLTLGADLERTEYELVSCIGEQEVDQSVDALYTQLTLPLGSTLSTTAGWRRSRVDNEITSSVGDARLDDSLSAGSLGLVYRPRQGLRLFLRADENFRFATVDEHTNVVFAQPVGIENQSGISYESGIEWRQEGLQLKALLYRIELEDEISFDSSGFTNTNLEQTRRDGVILEARWQLSPGLRFNGSFSYTDPTITAGPFEGNRIPLVSERSARFSLAWQPREAWHLQIENILRSDRVFGSDFANALGTLPGYGLLNLSTNYTQGPWRLGLRLDNLLDKEYESSGSVGFDTSFTARASYFTAPERSLWLTARYQIE